MSCTHERRRWVEVAPFPEDPDYTTREEEVEYTVVDLDLHRYKCTQCGKVMYYSESARKMYEGG
ncbi:hypothetical protein DLP3_046 [Stenotrophomonas phage vB_SmaS_DLP_3]|nr:hypothetical protein DLP3_046 [Stenotrophomonas phage vB_SmaS_DLP_3]